MKEKSVPLVLLISTDLFFGMRIKNSAQQLGVHPIWIENIEAWSENRHRLEASEHSIVFLDLASNLNWQHLLSQAKNDERTKHVRWIAFGSHIDTKILKEAKHLGADQVMARSKFTQSLPALLFTIK